MQAKNALAHSQTIKVFYSMFVYRKKNILFSGVFKLGGVVGGGGFN